MNTQTNQATHTPGPWAMIESPLPEADTVAVAETGETICEFPAGFAHPRECANARLIAAAPELLQFAIDIRDNNDSTVSQIRAANALIARATGGAV